MIKERNLYLDVLKAISIILVVFGHSMQYGSGLAYLQSDLFLYNPVFIFIYSFHMPLFMLISGYLFYYSAKNRSAVELLKAKSKQILIPLACWSVVSLIVNLVKIIAGVSSQKISLLWLGQSLVSGFWGGPWFLWAIWWCSIAIIIGRTLFKDNPIFYFILCSLTLIMPDGIVPAVYKFMLPYYILAYLFNKYNLAEKMKKLYTHKAFGFAILFIFLILLPHFNYDTYIYTTGYYILDKPVVFQLHNNCFRFVIGLIGSISIMCIVDAFMSITSKAINKGIAYLGTCSLGIYIISNYIFDEILKYLPVTGLNYCYTTIETICVLCVSLFITWALKKNRYTNKLLLGGR